MAKLKICRTIVEAKNIEVPSQTKDGTYYNVSPPTLFQDGMCDCPDFLYRNHICKHLRKVAEYRCHWWQEYNEKNAEALDGLEECPVCRGPVSDFETEAEHD